MCLCIPLPTFECLNQSLRNLVCISWHQNSSHRRPSHQSMCLFIYPLIVAKQRTSCEVRTEFINIVQTKPKLQRVNLPALWLTASVELSVQLWSVNQRTTENEESPLLRFVTRVRLVKTLQRIIHCGELLPSEDK
jgi:hypothetical protein